MRRTSPANRVITLEGRIAASVTPYPPTLPEPEFLETARWLSMNYTHQQERPDCPQPNESHHPQAAEPESPTPDRHAPQRGTVADRPRSHQRQPSQRSQGQRRDEQPDERRDESPVGPVQAAAS